MNPDAAPTHSRGPSRRVLLQAGAVGVAGVAAGTFNGLTAPFLARRGLLSPDGVLTAAGTAVADTLFYKEVYPTSPLILEPFKDDLLVPRALRPASDVDLWDSIPSADPGCQNGSDGRYGTSGPDCLGNEQHQVWPDKLGLPDPVVYKIDVLVDQHAFTTSKVRQINALGQDAISFDATGRKYAAGTVRDLPRSTIYGFNGTFPGPMINAEYGKPAVVRFVNRLDENPARLDRQDFGAPDWTFLVHLHNAHTAPESDGNPHYSMRSGPMGVGYKPGQWVDNLYLNWAAGGDDREKQSFFWFHDHRMDHTGANVYKGLVGLYPIYDPKDGLDDGDERTGLRLPGVRQDHSDGSFDVDYDVPLAFSDVRLDDGVTTHVDMHDGMGEFPDARNPAAHPTWWGKTFYKHFPNHGFVGDIFAVNGTAYPVMKVKRRRYRFRFLDASVARIYEFKLMRSAEGPRSSASLGYTLNELQGQYRLRDGQQCMQFTQIAADGGLLPYPIVRDSFELWPAKRREVVIDFTHYQDGTETKPGDEIYLTNVMKMPDGRMWSNSSRFTPDPAYKVPVMKFVLEDAVEDNSVMPTPTTKLRDLPPLPADWKKLMNNRLIFEVQRGSAGGEIEWLVNGKPFDPAKVVNSLRNPAGKILPAQQKVGSYNLWEIRNGGGGWVHPFHLHMEEHRVVMRNGRDVSQTPDRGHPDDKAREDLVALDPGESVIVYRGFRDFTGPYVAHCHNLAHEDHAMMFGWEIVP